MTKEKEPYTSYLLRIWPTKHNGEWIWRASLESPYTGERQGFASLQEMFTFLEKQTDCKLISDKK